MKRPRTPTPKEVIRERTDKRPLGLQYAEVLHLRKAVEDAESKGTSPVNCSPHKPGRSIKPSIN
jgi:hypothetical protein